MRSKAWNNLIEFKTRCTQIRAGKTLKTKYGKTQRFVWFLKIDREHTLYVSDVHNYYYLCDCTLFFVKICSRIENSTNIAITVVAFCFHYTFRSLVARYLDYLFLKRAYEFQRQRDFYSFERTNIIVVVVY